jgi:hypothetical protein
VDFGTWQKIVASGLSNIEAAKLTAGGVCQAKIEIRKEEGPTLLLKPKAITTCYLSRSFPSLRPLSYNPSKRITFPLSSRSN